MALSAQAGVLPDDRADIMYHRYEGGGVTIDGPSLLIRKSMLDNLSVSLNYYVDNVTSASIDVKFITGASVYTEKREEQSLNLTYLNNNTTMNLGYTNSEESDYLAKTVSFSIAQDFFGNLSTLSMGYSQGDDDVRENIYSSGSIIDTEEKGTVDRQAFRLAFSQILTKNWTTNLTLETIEDEGFLNNPYRQVRYLIDPATYERADERYPATHTSDALAFRSTYFWPWWRAALKFEARRFSDTWGINGKTFELKYTHPIDDHWIVEGKVRHYGQNRADFYADLFPYVDAQNFLARDKELSTYTTNTFGFSVSYEWKNLDFGFIERASTSLYYDYIQFDYDDFRDVTAGTVVGQEPLYQFNASALRLIFSVYY